jgi:hypothetical protein
MPTNFTSPVFDPTTSGNIISRALTRLVKRFKNNQVQAMVIGPHTGRLYESRNVGHGVGFKRYHRASARGGAPSPDTFNLINALKDEKVTQLDHRIYVDDSQAPYGKYLQDPEILDRPIATKEQAEEFIKTPEGLNEILKARAELINGITGAT